MSKYANAIPISYYSNIMVAQRAILFERSKHMHDENIMSECALPYVPSQEHLLLLITSAL